MKVFTSTAFEGHWPVGTAAVSFAETIEDACQLLATAVAQCGLKQEIRPTMLVEVDPTVPAAIILRDGEY